MKKMWAAFLAGVVTAGLIGGAGLTVFASSGAVEFNAVGLSAGGEQVAAAGEDLVLENGARVPTTILYTDETGAGVTYLPARLISQIFGVEIGWDAPTGSVTIEEGATATAVPIAETAADREEPASETVYLTESGEKYHREGCRYLQNSRIAVSLDDAREKGYTPCSVCAPPQ